MNINANTWKTYRLAGMICLAVFGLVITGCSDSSTTPELEVPVVIDTAPPAVPTGLSAAAANTHVKVTWLPNTTDVDFNGFMLYRIAFGQSWPLLDSPSTELTYLDENPLRRPCKYAVTAIDESGNESAWQEVFFQGIDGLPDREQE